MSLVTTKEMFKVALQKGFAIPAFNIDDLNGLKAIIKGCEELKSPVIIAVTGGSLKFIGKGFVKGIVDLATKNTTIPVALHLDHGKSVELCKECVDLGFTSVMIDASAYDFKENIRQTREVVEYAHKRGVVVESELGAIAGVEDDLMVDDKYGRFTHPLEAKEFVEKTGIDSLAIAIGTAHGAYKFKPDQKPELRFDILDEIHSLLPDTPLVLHGASSVPDESVELLNEYGGKMEKTKGIPLPMLKEATRRGICKINVASDLRIAYTGAFRKALAQKPEVFDYKVFIEKAMDAITERVKFEIINIMGSNGHADDFK